MSKKIDLTNQIFGKLTVINIVENKNYSRSHSLYWLCKCECGKEKIILGSNLKSGKSKSCGCMVKISKTLFDKNVALLSTAKEVFRSNKYNDGDLTFEEFYNLSQMPCHYCKSDVSESYSITNRFISRHNKGKSVSKFALDNGYFQYNGLDRIDSNYKHNKNNVVTCCTFCNGFKLDDTLYDFHKKLNKLYNHTIPITISNIKIKESLKDFVEKFPYKDKRNKTKILKEISWIKSRAKTRKLDFNLTKEQRCKLITSPCTYCGSFTSTFNGVDRLDSNKGYIEDNCISACKTCNIGKNERSFQEFLEWINKVKKIQKLEYKNNPINF